MYVVMDGFDLGIGLLFPFFEAKDDRDVMMNTVAPVWDGNETWLVLGGAGLLAAFPLAYAVVLSAFYLPLILMLIGLIFRGVAFEFRFKASAEQARLVGSGLHRRLDAGDLLPGRGAGRLHRRRSRARRPLRRRGARLAVGVLGLHRPGAARDLRAARQHLAGHEDRRAAALAHEAAGALPGLGAAAVHRRRSACGRRWRTSASPSAGSAGRTWSGSCPCRCWWR